MKEYITDKTKEGRDNQIEQVTELSNNIDNGKKIWAVKQRVKRKNETPCFIKKKKKKKIENKEEILK